MQKGNTTLSVLVASVAVIIAICAFWSASNANGTAANAAGSTANSTHTAGYYDAGLGFKVNGTTVFNSSKQLIVGSAGTAVSGINFGTCYVRPYAATIAASSTAQVDCQATQNFMSGPGTALAGITAADVIQLDLGSTTVGTLFGGLKLRTAFGSTTAGWITLSVQNDTGATYTWSITANASGTAQYIAVR